MSSPPAPSTSKPATSKPPILKSSTSKAGGFARRSSAPKGFVYRQVILFLIMFVNMIGFGIIMPILPFYAENLGASATHLGLLFSVYSVMQFFFAPLWGRLSDRIGRKPVIVAGLAGFSLSFFLFGLSTQLWMLYAARILGGILSSAALPTVMAYVADTSDDEHRGGAMGRISAAMGLGITFGPVMGGFLGEIGPAFPFFFAAGTGAMICVFAGVFLPESLAESVRAAARARPRPRAGPSGMITALRGPVGFVLVLALLSNFASSNLQGTFALFSEAQFGAGKSELGILFGAMGSAMAAAQGFLIGPMIRRWGEQRTIQLGLLCNGTGYVGFLFANSVWTILPCMLLMGFGFAAMMPSVNSWVSKRGDPQQQGMNMGIVNAFSSLGRVFGPLIGGLIFDYVGPQWPYVVGACIFFAALLFAIVQFRRDARTRPRPVSASAD